MRKILCVMLLGISIFILSSCSHTHTYQNVWSTDDEYHWRIAECCENELPDKAKHQFKYDSKIGLEMCEVCHFAKDINVVFHLGDEKVTKTVKVDDIAAFKVEKSGYHFAGWYLDKEYQNPYDKDKITNSMNLYAKWDQTEVFIYEAYQHGYQIVNYLGKDKIITIPDNYQGLPVIRIANTTFGENDYIEEIYVPNSIESIEQNTFGGCKKLIKLTLPFPGLSRTEGSMINLFGALSHNKIDDFSYLNPDAYVDYIGHCLEEVIITEGIDVLIANSFRDTYRIRKLYLPKSITKIEKSVFLYALIGEVFYAGTIDDWNKIELSSKTSSNPKMATKKVSILDNDGKYYDASHLIGFETQSGWW